MSYTPLPIATTEPSGSDEAVPVRLVPVTTPVDSHLLEPGTGFHVRMTPIGDLRVAQPYRVVGTVFFNSVDTRFWTVSNSGAGSAAGVANGIATLTSGTANNGYGVIRSVRSGRFIFAHPMQFRAAVRVPDTTELNNTRYFGTFTTSGATTPANGFAFEFNGSGALTLKCYNGGAVSYSATSGAFNGEVTSYTLDSNVHAYEIMYFIMGAWFFIDGVLIHKFTPTTSMLSGTFDLPITAISLNSASGTESADLEVWSANIARMGRDLTMPVSYYHAAGTTAGVTLKVGAGSLRHLVISNVSTNANLTIYDNTAASGTVLFTTGGMPATTQPFDIDLEDLAFFTGLTFAVTGAACSVVVIYE